jgi:hypothetical protein
MMRKRRRSDVEDGEARGVEYKKMKGLGYSLCSKLW